MCHKMLYSLNILQGSAAGEVQRAEFTSSCEMRKQQDVLTEREPLISLSDFEIICYKRPRFIRVYNCLYLFSKFQTLGADMRANNNRE